MLLWKVRFIYVTLLKVKKLESRWEMTKKEDLEAEIEKRKEIIRSHDTRDPGAENGTNVTDQDQEKGRVKLRRKSI